MQRSEVYNLISFNKSIHLYNYHLRQDLEHFCHPESPLLSHASQSPRPKGNHCPDFYHHRLFLSVLALYMYSSVSGFLKKYF